MLHVKISKYRTYERDTASGGASTPTSSSGGGSSPTSSVASAHRHRMFDQGNGTALGLANKSISAWNENTGTAVVLDLPTNATFLDTRNAGGSHSHTTTVAPHDHDVNVPSHVHQQTYDIFEAADYPGPVSVVLDGVNIDSIVNGPWQASASEEWFHADLGDVLTQPGVHQLRFEAASGKGRLTPIVLVKSLQLQ